MAGLSVETNATTDEMDENNLAHSMCSALESMLPLTWQRLKEETTSDETMQLLLSTIEEGFPSKQADVPLNIRPFFIHRPHLYTVDGVAVFTDRVVIPPSLRAECLQALHSAQQGTTMMQSRADASVFWPGIAADIAHHRATCTMCNTMSPSQASLPPTTPTLPTRPFQSLCADYFHHKGYTYVVIVDRFSGWPIVERSTNGATGLISNLRSIFVTFGIPDDLTTDGGPEFTASSTKKFLADWGVHHRLCSVAYPHGNSHAEIGVKTIKRAPAGNTQDNGELDCDSFQRAILTYRNTPDPITKISPAIAVFARPIKDLIPVLPGKLHLHPYWDKLLDHREATMATRSETELGKWSEHTHPLPQLKVGDVVRVQNQTGPFPRRWDKTGTVIEVCQFHQYLVRLAGSGRATLRNRKFLRKCAAPSPPAVRGHLPDTPVHQQDETSLPDHVPMTTPLEFNTDTATQDTPSTDTSQQPQDTPPTPLPPGTPPSRALDTPSSPLPVSTPTPSRPTSPAAVRIPALRRSKRQCVTNHRPNYKE